MSWIKYWRIIREMPTAIWFVAFLCMARPPLLDITLRHPLWLVPGGIFLAAIVLSAIIVCFIMDMIRRVRRDRREALLGQRGFEVITSSGANDKSSTGIQIGELSEPISVVPISTPPIGQDS